MVNMSRHFCGGVNSAVERFAAEENTIPDLKIWASGELISAERGDMNTVFKEYVL